MKLRFFLLAPQQGQLFNVSLKIKNISACGALVEYQSLNANMPFTYNNSVALWDSLIPNIGAPEQPLTVTAIPTNQQPDVVFVKYPIVNADYCLTYQVGPSATTMCSLAQHSASVSAFPNPPTSVDIDVKDVTTNSVRILYSTLPGYLPRTYNNWIGVWQGFASPYSAPAALASVTIPSDATEGYAVLNNVSISPDFTYTVVYFCGTSKLEAAAMRYFQTQGS